MTGERHEPAREQIGAANNEAPDETLQFHGMLTIDYFSVLKTIRTANGTWRVVANWTPVPFPLAMVIYGKGDPASDAGKRVYTTLRRAHRVASPATANDERLQDLFLVELDTRLRGTKLLGSEPLAVADYIEQFIQRRLVDRAASFPWHDRSRTVH